LNDATPPEPRTIPYTLHQTVNVSVLLNTPTHTLIYVPTARPRACRVYKTKAKKDDRCYTRDGDPKPTHILPLNANDSTLPIHPLIKRQASVNVGFELAGLETMIGKRVQFDDETWEAVQAVMRDAGISFQDIADEAFADVLKSTSNLSG
jgi:hypothetical protein